MTLTDIREELLGQHASLRRLAAQAKEVATHPLGAGAGAELARRLRALGDAVDAHNTREELLLADVLPTLDAWGTVRAARMDEHHRQEHFRLRAAVRSAAETREVFASARAALRVIEELLEHMRAEEAEIINPDVLRDDVINIDQSDG